jgi:hypothetical protein
MGEKIGNDIPLIKKKYLRCQVDTFYLWFSLKPLFKRLIKSVDLTFLLENYFVY